jgi:hypothetical protein
MTKNSGTHDFLIGTHQNFIMQKDLCLKVKQNKKISIL